MSTFRTPLPVDIDAVKAMLPKGASVEKIDWDPQLQILSMIWHHQRIATPYTFPVEFTIEQLESGKLPYKAQETEAPKLPGAPTRERPMGDDPEATKAAAAAKPPKPAKKTKAPAAV